VTTPRDINQAMTLHSHLTTLARMRLPAAVIQITRETGELDGYPSIASGADTGRGGHSEDSVVDRTVQARLARNKADSVALGPTAKLDELLDLLVTANRALDLLVKECDRHAPGLTRSDIDRLRCIGTGNPDGATCTQIATPRPHPNGNGSLIDDGRCLDCGRTHDAEERARQEQAAEERRRRAEQAAYMREYRKARR